MTYYKVKSQYDQKPQFDKRGKYAGLYIANELYTDKEVEKRNLNRAFLELVEVSKKKVYWFFGARFESTEV